MFSLGSLLTQIFSRERKREADAARTLLVERLATHGQRAFAEVARRTGLVSGPASGEGPSLTGELRGVAVVVSIAENRGEGLMTRFSARAPVARSVVINTGPRPRGLAAIVRPPRGIGDPEFDAVFTTVASDEASARAVLDERARSTLLSLPDRLPLYFDHREGEVTLDVSGVELDPERLVFLLEWLAEVAAGHPEGEKPYRG